MGRSSEQSHVRNDIVFNEPTAGLRLIQSFTGFLLEASAPRIYRQPFVNYFGGDFSLLWRNWCPHYQKDHGKYRMRGECSSAWPQILPWSCNVEWSCSEPIEDAVFITTWSTVPRSSQLLILSLSCCFAASHAIDMISRFAESPSDRAAKIKIYKAALSPTIE